MKISLNGLVNTPETTTRQFVEIPGVYKILCTQNNKVYIGSSISLGDRLSCHLSSLTSNTHHNNHLQNAWNKYGEGKFVFEILEICDIESTITREQYYLDTILKADEYILSKNPYFLDNGFNINPKAEGQKGMVRTDEFKDKVSIGLKKYWQELEEDRKEIIKQKLSLARRGRPQKGKKVIVYNSTTGGEVVFEKVKEAAEVYNVSRTHLASNLRKGHNFRHLNHLQFRYYEN